MMSLGARLSISDLYCKFLGLFSFLVSLIIYPLYVKGDQEHYRLFYDSVSSYSISEAYAVYFSSLGSLEPVYFILVYYLSPFLDKDVLFSSLNGILFYLFAKLLLRYRINKVVVFSFILNFYVLVLFFAAERLKIAVIIFLLAFLFINKKRFAVLIFSVLAHLQMAIAFTLYVSKELSPDIFKLLKGRLSYKLIGMLVLTVLVVLLIFPLYEQVYKKFLFYMSTSDGFLEVLKPVVFYLLTLIYAQNKKLELTLMSLVLFVAVFFVGSDRLVMFSYFIFLFYALPKKNGFEFFVIIVNSYFIYKSYSFIANVVACGEAFTCVG